MKLLARNIAYRIWRTDERFYQYPYGPPQRGLSNGIAWNLYHWSIRPSHPMTRRRVSTKALLLWTVGFIIAWALWSYGPDVIRGWR